MLVEVLPLALCSKRRKTGTRRTLNMRLLCIAHILLIRDAKRNPISYRFNFPVAVGPSKEVLEELTTRFNSRSGPGAGTAGGGLGDASEAEAVAVLREIRSLLVTADKTSDKEDDLQKKRDAWQEVIVALDHFCFRFFAVFLALLFIIVLVILPEVTQTT